MRPAILIALLVSLLATPGCPSEEPDDDIAGDDDSTGDDDSAGDDDTLGDDDTQGDDDSAQIDADGDGFGSSEDCDDSDPETWPGAPEQCDGEDNDCDGVVPADEEDADADDWPACEGDCDDGDPTVGPGFEELCDGLDNDCDLDVDEGTDQDLDGDGYTLCTGDCDDADSGVNPGESEACDGKDTDCDGVVPADEVDMDWDGHPLCDDCDDYNVFIYPGAPEQCGNVDHNCDGVVGDFGLCGIIDLSAADAKLVGEDESVFAGTAVSTVGDTNGDGYDDVIVGATGLEMGGYFAGGAYLVLGPVSGTLDLSDADAVLYGESLYDFAGGSVSAAGDVNGDGYDDLFLGAPGEASSNGAAYLVLSPVSGTVELSASTAKLTGEAPHDRAGDSVSTAGDVNGDGYDDLLVGALFQDAGGDDAGAAYVVHGPVSGTLDLSVANAKLVGEYADSWAGMSVSSAADMNGDGYGDVIVGATGGYNGAGAAYLVMGPISGTMDLGSASAKLVGENPQDYAGISVSSAGDVNGDGFPDLLVGAHGQDQGGTSAGAVYLVLGPVSGTVDLSTAAAKLVGEDAEDGAGRSVSCTGDVNGDSYDDLVVGATGQDSGGAGAGAAYLVLGTASGSIDLSVAAAKLVGEEPGDYAGESVSSAGDVNGDGFDDLLVGASGNYAGGNLAGAAYLLLGGP